MVPLLVLFLTVTNLVQKVYSDCGSAFEESLEDDGFSHRSTGRKHVFCLCRNIFSIEDVTKNANDSFISYPARDYLIKIKITGSVVSTIPASSFEGFTSLPGLELTNIGIRNISAGAFDKLENLQILNINSNLLEKIDDGIFNSLQHLEELDLSNNKIEKISRSAFFGLNSLTSLNLSSNRLVKIDSDVSRNLPNLYNLDVSKNPLKEIYLDQPYRSFEVDLTGTLVTHENFHSGVENFYILNWSRSELSEINISSLHFVWNLDLSHNNIKSIEDLDTLELQKIILHHNKVTVIDDEFFRKQLNWLSFLDLSFNEIREIGAKAFQNLDYLKHLYLNNNNISKIEPTLFRNMEQLEILNLSCNSIKNFQFGTFSSLSKLLILDISHNRLTNLPEIRALNRMERLYFHSNQIACLNVENLKRNNQNLKIVSLLGNNFTRQNLVRVVQDLNYFHISRSKGASFDSDIYDKSSFYKNSGFNSAPMVLQMSMRE